MRTIRCVGHTARPNTGREMSFEAPPLPTTRSAGNPRNVRSGQHHITCRRRSSASAETGETSYPAQNGHAAISFPTRSRSNTKGRHACQHVRAGNPAAHHHRCGTAPDGPGCPASNLVHSSFLFFFPTSRMYGKSLLIRREMTSPALLHAPCNASHCLTILLAYTCLRLMLFASRAAPATHRARR